MSDIRSSGEYVLVNDNLTNDVVIHKSISGRIETLQKIDVRVDYSEFLIQDMPILPEVGECVEAGTMYTDGTLNWAAIQSHNMTIYPPIETPALFRQYREQGSEWIQPLNEYDAYYLHDWVTHSGKNWKTIIETPNVWEPGVVGSENLWNEIIDEI